jgi:hypothetical protein
MAGCAEATSHGTETGPAGRVFVENETTSLRAPYPTLTRTLPL